MRCWKSGAANQVEITDGDQRVRITLGDKVPDALADYELEGGALIEFFYVAPQGDAVVAAVEDADPPLGYDSVVPQRFALAVSAAEHSCRCCCSWD